MTRIVASSKSWAPPASKDFSTTTSRHSFTSSIWLHFASPRTQLPARHEGRVQGNFLDDRRHADQLPVGCPEDDIWLERPVAFTQEGEALWKTFQQEATEDTLRQLLDGTHPSQSQRAPLAAQVVSKNPAASSSSVAAGSTSAAAPRDSSKRIRKPNSRFSDYEQDEPSRLRKRSSGTAAATAVNLATANYSDDSLADGNYNDKDVDDEDEFSEEDNIVASDLSPAKSKGKKKASRRRSPLAK
ncbi:unnamed protein product [Tilletia caries]|uniref:Uncharacterized protein n=2 Tax=Tilletia TaxID=13289 RepID=A0A8X7SS19_9BASI|nr:hypothetical protein A4X06_0g9689 [Tilletia controversa]CAD6884402.1 unnamed protein product [Tilletia caries]